jgi:hypothetical protein
MPSQSQETHLQSASPTEGTNAIVQRLDQLERKLDSLLSVVHLLESTSDQRWRGLDGASPHHEQCLADATRVAALGAEFAATIKQRDRVWAAQQRGATGQAWTAEQEARVAVELDPLHDRLFAVAAALSRLPASRDSELVFKAAAIQEFCEEDSDDIVHQLASSLAADLLSRRPPEP